jgi:uncharacterized protein (DUF4415 family)
MRKLKVNPELIDAENPEWTKEDFKKAVPFSGLPVDLRQAITSSRKRGPQKSPTKERITIRLSPQVVTRFRAMGKGWQGKIDEALQDWLKHKRGA